MGTRYREIATNYMANICAGLMGGLVVAMYPNLQALQSPDTFKGYIAYFIVSMMAILSGFLLIKMFDKLFYPEHY